MASDHGSWGAAALLPLDIAEVRNAKPSLLLFIHCILIRNTLPMLWSCGNLACLHPKLLPVCLWDVIYLESLGKYIPQRDPRFISGASVDISLLCSQWFFLCHCSLAGSPPRLNKDLKKNTSFSGYSTWIGGCKAFLSRCGAMNSLFNFIF